MDNNKLGLDKLKVQSFVTSFSDDKKQTIKGGEMHTEINDPNNPYGCATKYAADPACDNPDSEVYTNCDPN